jgi:hypothetical protein
MCNARKAAASAMDSVPGGKRDDLLTPSDEEWVRDHEQCIGPLLDHDAKSSLKISFSMGWQRLEA